MKKIDTSEWQKFRVGDILTVNPTNKLSAIGKNYIMDRDIISDNGTVPYIAATSLNNGIKGYSNILANNKCDCITLSTTADSSNTVFYQEKDFIGRQQIACMRRKDDKPIGVDCGLYLASIIRKITLQFDYSNKLTKDCLLDSKLLLPAKKALTPDWELMSKIFGGGVSDMSNIDTSTWKEFKIRELFGACKLGKYHNPKDLEEAENGYSYICATNQNNGINKDKPKVIGNNIVLTKGHIISWGKQCPMFSYHKNPCVTAQGMYYIELPDTINESVALFLCSILTKTCEEKYGYENCLIGSKMDELAIKLPAKETVEPDWEYMEQYISKIDAEVNYKINILQTAIAKNKSGGDR